MKTNIFFNELSSQQLKENFTKQFGSKVNLDKYTREQLEDMRNKLRTRVFQQEGSAGYNDLLTNETYQKDKAMLQLLNTRIKEMLGEDIKKLRDKMVELSEAKKGVRDIKHSKKAKGSTKGDGNLANNYPPYDKVTRGDVIAGATGKDQKGGKKADESVEEGWDDMMKAVKDKAGPQPSGGAGVKKGRAYGGAAQKDVKEPEENKSKKTKESAVAERDEGKPGKGFEKIVKAATPKYGKERAKKIAGAQREKMKKAGKLEESQFKKNVRTVNESLRRMINEDEEGKAKAITAASDMVNDFTSWMQRVGQYQTKAIIELADAIRADFGLEQAEAFKTAVSPALAATLETLTQQRETISNAVAVLAGEDVPPGEQMGAEPDMGPEEPGMDLAAPDEMNPEPAGDEFAASDAAAGGPESSGREVRESKFARKLAESHSIMAKLAK